MEEIARGFQFLASLDQNGEVYKAMLPVLSGLRRGAEKEDSTATKAGVVDSGTDGNPTRQDHETMLIAIHKAMCEEKFICIYEKPSAVPDFAAPVKGIIHLSNMICRDKCQHF